MRIGFTIHGTQEDGAANAIPKQRLTRAQSWTPKAQRYDAYKRWVRTQLVTGARILDEHPTDEQRRWLQERIRDAALDRKPFDTRSAPARMTVVLHWRDEHHPDPENAFGAIADALFDDDKHLAGAFEFEHREGKAMQPGRVEVCLEIGP